MRLYVARRSSLMVKMRQLPVGEADGTVTKTYRFPKRLAKRLMAIAKERGISENKLIVPFVEWACDEYEAENGVPGERAKR